MEPTQQDPEAQVAPTPITVASRVANVATRFYFHEALKQSSFSKHFIAEDLEAPPGAPSPCFYFFKQNIYDHEGEFRHALAYYQKLRGYCTQPHTKSDVIKLHELLVAEDAAASYFELILLFDLGDSDRIDVEQIKVHQLTKFLKTVCLLLQDLKKRSDLYHGNISIKNIILADDELKISGFKPIFLNNPAYQNWKTELCSRHSHHRLDLYMIGLIWLRLLGVRIEEMTAGAKDLDTMADQIMANYHALTDDKKANIVEQLLDLKNRSALDLEDVILLFDEYFVLETRRLMEMTAESSTEQGFHQSLTDQERGSAAHNRDSLGADGNVFTKGLNDSGIDNMTFKDGGAVPEGPVAGFKIDNDFTVQDNVTFHEFDRKGGSLAGGSQLGDLQMGMKVEKRSSDIQSVDRNAGHEADQKGTTSERLISGKAVKKEASMSTFKNADSSSSLPVNESLMGTGKDEFGGQVQIVDQSAGDSPADGAHEGEAGQQPPPSDVIEGEAIAEAGVHQDVQGVIGSQKMSTKSVPKSPQASVKSVAHAQDPSARSLAHSQAGQAVAGSKKSVPGSAKQSVTAGSSKQKSVRGEAGELPTPPGSTKKQGALDAQATPGATRTTSGTSQNGKKVSISTPEQKEARKTSKSPAPAKSGSIVQKVDKPEPKASVATPKRETIKAEPVKKPSVIEPRGKSIDKGAPKQSVSGPSGKSSVAKGGHKASARANGGSQPPAPEAPLAQPEPIPEPPKEEEQPRPPAVIPIEEPAPEIIPEPKEVGELNDAIDKAADQLESIQKAGKASAARASQPPGRSRVSVPKRASKVKAPSTPPEGGQAQTVGQAQKKLNLRQQLDQMNEKLREIHRPLNYYDYDHYSSLNIKRQTPVSQITPEVAPEKLELIRQKLKQEQSAKAEQERQKSQERMAQMERRKQEADDVAAALKAKIEGILEKKLAEKKQQERLAKTGKVGETKPVETKMYGVVLSTMPIEGKGPGYGYGTRQATSPAKAPHDNSPTTANGAAGVSETLPLKSTAHSGLKRTFKSAKANDPAAFTSYKDKNNIFAYNLDLQNKNVPYKKLAKNPDQFIKTSDLEPASPKGRAQSPVYASGEDRSASARFKKTGKPVVYASEEPPEATRGGKNDLSDFNSLLKELKDKAYESKGQSWDPERYPKLNAFLIQKQQANPKPKDDKEEQVLGQVREKLDAEDYVGGLQALEEADIDQDSDLKPSMQAQAIASAAHGRDPQAVRKGLIDLYDSLSSNAQMGVDPELTQDIALALADIENDGGDRDNVQRLLQSSAIKPGTSLSPEHEALLLESLGQPGRELELASYYESQIDASLSDSFRHLDISKLFINISRVIELLAGSKDTTRLARFYNKVLGALRRIKGLHTALSTTEHDYENLIECFVMNTLRFANRSQNLGLSNFVIGEALRHGHIDLANLNEDERRELAVMVSEFCWRLKDLPNYGGFKETYFRYLTYCKNVIKQCDLNADNLRLSLLVNFNRGVFYLKDGNHKKAHALFDKCLLTYYAFFKEADQDLYQVLFNLGEALWTKGKLSESFYFFNRVLDEQCTNEDLKKEARKRLGQIKFHGESPEDAKTSLAPFIDEHFQDRRPANFYRLLCLYFLACEKTQSEDFGRYFKRLGELPPTALTQEVYWYFKMFKQFQKVYEEHHNYRENKRFLALFEEIGKGEGGPGGLNVKRFVNAAALVFADFVGGANQGIKVNEAAAVSQANQAKQSLIGAFYDQFLTVEENAVVIARYMMNLVLVLLHLLPLYNERQNNQQFRHKTFEGVEQACPVEDIQNEVHALVKVAAAEARKRSTKMFEAVPQPEAEDSRLPKMLSAQVLDGATKEPESWALANEFGGNAQLQALVKEFLKQVKNMLFLDVVENVLTYYLRFEASLIDLGLNYPKYNFIKQLIKMHLARGAGKPIDNAAFVGLLDQLFSTHNISLADLKLLVILLEAFKDIDYLRLLTLYLDRCHKEHAKLFLRDLSYEQFVRKATFVAEQLYAQVAQAKYYELENCYFMHYLDSQHFIYLEKQLMFKMFLRLRHDLLNDPAMRQVIGEYVDPAELAYFDLRYQVYKAIVRRVRNRQADNGQVFEEFAEKFEDALGQYRHDDGQTSAVLYDLGLLGVLLDANSGQDAANALMASLEKLLGSCRGSLTYQYSRIHSMMGNILFKYSLMDECLAAKLKAQELLSEDAKNGVPEPKFAPPCTREQHQFQIWSFLIASYLERDDDKSAAALMERLDKSTSSDASIQLNRQVLKCLVNLSQNKTSDALKNVYEAIGLFGKMKLTDFQNRMYQAILDRCTLMVIERSQSPEELEVVQKKSRVSIAKLYELPADD
jgi:hypothetical protein